MEYIKLLIGIALMLIFTWLLIRNFKRKGLINALLRLDTIVGIISGGYLAVTSIHSLVN